MLAQQVKTQTSQKSTEQLLWRNGKWQGMSSLNDASLVIYFGGKETLGDSARFSELKSFYPNAHIIGCSTGGEIYNEDVWDNTIAVSAIKFNKTPLKTAIFKINSSADSFNAGSSIAKALNSSDLKNIFILSDGTNVNGSELVDGIYSVVGKNVIVTGGLAGDGANFASTLVGLDSAPETHNIVAVGFYGDAIQVGCGSVGGWDNFGPKRKITKSSANVLYELDGKPALDLYKEYLGAEEAAKLPGSALLFPLNIYPDGEENKAVVRTIVGVDETAKTMTFAGDVQEGYTAQLMHGDFNNLVNGAAKAAELALKGENAENSIAILISCIGRKLLMGQAISDESEAVQEAFAAKIPTIGFYSYGEICHQQFTSECRLHNQTMTITVLHESN